MKVKNISLQQSSNKIVLKIEKLFFQGKVRFKQLFKDVFEKKQNNVKKIEYPRNLPNSISAKDEKFGIGGGRYLRYFQEDIEKMKTMSEDEIIEFKRKLREEKKYYLE